MVRDALFNFQVGSMHKPETDEPQWPHPIRMLFWRVRKIIDEIKRN
jgi:hypothetical protein